MPQNITLEKIDLFFRGYALVSTKFSSREFLAGKVKLLRRRHVMVGKHYYVQLLLRICKYFLVLWLHGYIRHDVGENCSLLTIWSCFILQGILSLCVLFENLLQTHEPALFYHLKEIGAHPWVLMRFLEECVSSWARKGTGKTGGGNGKAGNVKSKGSGTRIKERKTDTKPPPSPPPPPPPLPAKHWYPLYSYVWFCYRLRLAFNWIIYAFAGYLDTEQVRNIKITFFFSFERACCIAGSLIVNQRCLQNVFSIFFFYWKKKSCILAYMFALFWLRQRLVRLLTKWRENFSQKYVPESVARAVRELVNLVT